MATENRLLAYRNLERLSQQELADILGLTQPTISQMEKHRRPLDIDASLLGYSPERFANLPSMSEPMHRARSSTRVTSRKAAKEILRLAGELYGLFLEEESRPTPPAALRAHR
jgi:transcriptional regulator with XRE-family HTH domain